MVAWWVSKVSWSVESISNRWDVCITRVESTFSYYPTTELYSSHIINSKQTLCLLSVRGKSRHEKMCAKPAIILPVNIRLKTNQILRVGGWYLVGLMKVIFVSTYIVYCAEKSAGIGRELIQSTDTACLI